MSSSATPRVRDRPRSHRPRARPVLRVRVDRFRLPVQRHARRPCSRSGSCGAQPGVSSRVRSTGSDEEAHGHVVEDLETFTRCVTAGDCTTCRPGTSRARRGLAGVQLLQRFAVEVHGASLHAEHRGPDPAVAHLAVEVVEDAHQNTNSRHGRHLIRTPLFGGYTVTPRTLWPGFNS